MQALQDQYAPHNKCFGCGPSNAQGLQIKSFVRGDEVVAHFYPKEHHQAFENVLSGGIVGTLLDCHSNWAGAYFIMQQQKADFVPCTVTARYSVDLLAPTPMDQELIIVAKPVLVTEKKAVMKATLTANGTVTATCDGIFVAVKPGHPGYHRW